MILSSAAFPLKLSLARLHISYFCPKKSFEWPSSVLSSAPLRNEDIDEMGKWEDSITPPNNVVCEKKWRAEDHETFRQQIVLKLETSWDHGGPVECKHVIINMAVPKDAGKWKGQSFVDSTHYKDWTERQSCKMSQMWQIYQCEIIKKLGIQI